MSRAKSSLQLLRDVEGSMGSFLIDPDYDVIDRDAPAFLDTATLEQVGRRVANSLASGQMQLPGAGEIALLFTRGALTGRRCKHGTIVLMGDTNLHAPTARIALAVCARQLDSFETLEQQVKQPVEESVTAESAAPPPAPRPKKQKKPKKNIWA